MNDKRMAAIEEIEQRVKVYEAEIARLEQLKEKLQALRITLNDLQQELSSQKLARKAPTRRGKTSVTTLAEMILREKGVPLASSQLVEELKQRGKAFKAKRPQDTVRKSLERDPTFKGITVPNSREIHWILAEWGDKYKDTYKTKGLASSS